MKYKLLLNNSDSKKELMTLNQIHSKYIKLDSLPNKLLNEMIDSYIKHKGYLHIINKNNNIHLAKKTKPPSLSSNTNNKRINSARLNKYLTPKNNNFKSIEVDNKKLKEKLSLKHKNYSAININDNSYNFHQKNQKNIINEDKKLLIYVNQVKVRIKGNKEDEKCNNSSKCKAPGKQKKENIKKLPFSKTANNFNTFKQNKTSGIFQKNKLLQEPMNSEKAIQTTLHHSNSVKNTSQMFLDKKKEIEKKISLIKEKVRNYFTKHRFSSIKDYFNDWLYYKRKKDYQKKIYLDEDSLYIYLKDKIGIKINKNEIQQIFQCNKTIFDIDNFKYFFFEENSGNKPLSIKDNFLFKETLFNSYNKFNKTNNNFASFSDVIKSSKDKMPNFKNDLLMSVLKEQKSKIVDQICTNFILNNTKNEYDYFEFYNLFQNLNIDKKIINKKVIKKVFNKYKNENDKVDIKYFIINLYRNDQINKEIFCEIEEDNKNLVNQNYYNSKPILLHLNRIEFPYKNKSNFKSTLIKKREKINDFNDNKQPSSIKEIERYKFKSTSPCFKKEIDFNNKINNNYTSNLSKFMKYNETKAAQRKLKKKKFFTLYDSGLRDKNLTSIVKSTKKKVVDVGGYKTIRINKKYQSDTVNTVTTKDNNDTYTQKLNKIERPISAYSKCLFGINSNNNNNNYRNNTKCFGNETLKIVSEDTRMQNLNSDIINLI